MELRVIFVIVVTLIKFNYAYNDQILVERFGLKPHNFDLSSVDISKRCPKDQICIFKCCVEGETMGRFKLCEPSKIGFSNVTIYNQELAPTNLSLEKAFKLVPGLMKDPIFAENSLWWYKAHLTQDGRLLLRFPNVYDRWKEIDNRHFCVEMKTDDNNTRPVFMVEYGIHNPRRPSSYRKWALILSTIFLILTLSVYILLPQLRDLNGIVLMSLIGCLIVTFITHSCLESNGTMKLWISSIMIMTFTYYFFKISSVCWLNIIFYRLLLARHRSKDTQEPAIKQMTKYCAYAFGVPLFLTITVATIELSDMTDMPTFITPQIQNKGNISFSEIESLYYLYIPLMILLAFNWIICIIKVAEFCKTSQQFAVVNEEQGAESLNRPMQFVKLLVLFTCNAYLEAFTVMYPKGSGDISSTYLLCMGPIIMIIFLCNQTVKELLVERTKALRTEVSNSHALVSVLSKK
ncbi:putative G-protein coupled receptor Mth-like 3 [Anticarsia gemmatalis]|uniref:putative G-protein coupled receptor Mth-like 3 n=1 Tax=Anticarsia gemmatalis TaxID=129554 RepID=UPI003F76700C